MIVNKSHIEIWKFIKTYNQFQLRTDLYRTHYLQWRWADNTTSTRPCRTTHHQPPLVTWHLMESDCTGAYSYSIIYTNLLGSVWTICIYSTYPHFVSAVIEPYWLKTCLLHYFSPTERNCEYSLSIVSSMIIIYQVAHAKHCSTKCWYWQKVKWSECRISFQQSSSSCCGYDTWWHPAS